MTRQNEFGCLMVLPDAKVSSKILEYGKTLLSDEMLYIDPEDPSFGRDDEPHVTVRFGFSKDLTLEDVKEIMNGVEPFVVEIKSISQFKCELYNVIKFDVESIDLHKLNSVCMKYPGINKFPVYHPHMTLGYVKPTVKIEDVKKLDLKFPVERVKYTGMDGQKFYLSLKKKGK